MAWARESQARASSRRQVKQAETERDLSIGESRAALESYSRDASSMARAAYAPLLAISLSTGVSGTLRKILGDNSRLGDCLWLELATCLVEFS
jgi:hypothetical protein